jgi:hypothetical protein
MEINYLQTYTDLRTHKLAFHEFMNIINKVYEHGHKRGVVHGIESCRDTLKAYENSTLEHQKN